MTPGKGPPAGGGQGTHCTPLFVNKSQEISAALGRVGLVFSMSFLPFMNLIKTLLVKRLLLRVVGWCFAWTQAEQNSLKTKTNFANFLEKLV